MPNSVELVVKVLADVSAANTSFTSMGKNLSAVLGLGAAGGASVAVIQASADFQSSMAKIQQAYNSADFAPGTANYSTAADKVLALSSAMATNFEDVAASMAQAAKVTDQYGNKLPTDKVNEFVDSNLRLKASSQGGIDALTSGRDMAMFTKMFSSQDYAGTGSAIAALTTQHPQSEETLWQAAIGIAQLGAPMGVSMSQALGIGNYLSDVGGGGTQGGASIGRMLLRMDTSADTVLDPQAKYADEQKRRTAQERLDDLQTSLKEGEAKHAEMFGQHGLKTQYRRHPSEVMAEEDRLAKLRRDITDQQSNIAHENDPERSWPRGKMNLPEMARTAGQTAEAYAELFKANPIEALLDFTRGIHALPASERGAAETKAGIVNVRDQKTIDLLSDQPASVDRMIGMAEDQFKTKTALDQISNVGLNTTNAHLEDLHNALRGGVVTAGEPARQAADKGIQDVRELITSGNWGKLESMVGEAATKFDALSGVLGPVGNVLGAGLLPALAIIAKGGGLAALGGAAGSIAAGAGGAAVAGGLAYVQIDEMRAEWDRLNAARQSVGAPPITMNIGDIIHHGGTPEEMFEAVKQQLITAWKTAMSGTPVNGAMGGSYTMGSAPR